MRRRLNSGTTFAEGSQVSRPPLPPPVSAPSSSSSIPAPVSGRQMRAASTSSADLDTIYSAAMSGSSSNIRRSGGDGIGVRLTSYAPPSFPTNAKSSPGTKSSTTESSRLETLALAARHSARADSGYPAVPTVNIKESPPVPRPQGARHRSGSNPVHIDPPSLDAPRFYRSSFSGVGSSNNNNNNGNNSTNPKTVNGHLKISNGLSSIPSSTPNPNGVNNLHGWSSSGSTNSSLPSSASSGRTVLHPVKETASEPTQRTRLRAASRSGADMDALLPPSSIGNAFHSSRVPRTASDVPALPSTEMAQRVSNIESVTGAHLVEIATRSLKESRYPRSPPSGAHSYSSSYSSSSSSSSSSSTTVVSKGGSPRFVPSPSLQPILPQGTTTSIPAHGLIPSTSSVDLAGKRLREEQLQKRFESARKFIEATLGQPLPTRDLHEALKDGVILCKVANRLRPGTVKQISQKNLPFVKMENILNFLNAAKKLGVQSSDLFQTVDLYEGKDMNQVLSTILTLERVVGGASRITGNEKRPEPAVINITRSDPPSPESVKPSVVTRARSRTAHAPSTTASIRPSSSAFYAAQVRKLEEESIRFGVGYDQPDSLGFKSNDRHQSTPVAYSRARSPTSDERMTHRPSLGDIIAKVEDMGLKNGEANLSAGKIDIGEPMEQRRYKGRTASYEPPPTIQKSLSGPLLPTAFGSSLQDPIRRKKKSISLDPQTANAVMGNPNYRDGYASPGSPGLVTHSSSYNALANLGPSSTGTRHHNRHPSDKTSESGSRSSFGSPASSRSSTPVHGLRKSGSGSEPLCEYLELWENGVLSSTFKLAIDKCIGRGQFGSVYQALHMTTGQVFAVKRIKIDGLKDHEMEMLMQEVELLKSLAHPSIVKYEGFVKTDDYLNIILEYVENGSLLRTLKLFGPFPEKLVVAYVVKILEGLVYLHGKQVVHCDLKSANILTTKNGNVKLSDFGVSLNLKVKESYFGAVAGTPNWMAPEVIELKGASPASDIWSLGCTVIELLTGRPPYADLLPMTTLFRIVEDERPPLPSNLSVDLLDFLCQCFQKDPNLRPNAGMLGRHNWIKRNFTLKELKPMDSLPFIRRRSMEPREKSFVQEALNDLGALDGIDRAAKRASTPLGLSSGTGTGTRPPPAASSASNSPAALTPARRPSVRRGSVDSAGNYYAVSTIPAPTNPQERMADMGQGYRVTKRHEFVKSSFAKPVDCKLCRTSVKKQAVICQDCNMVLHRKCQFYVGDTCYPAPPLEVFHTPSPASSFPNLKMLASGVVRKVASRPGSSASQDYSSRSRSVTPSQRGTSPVPGSSLGNSINATTALWS